MLRLMWRLFVLLTLAASCAVGWAWKHSAARAESIYLRGFGRYCMAVSHHGRVVALRVNGDPAARPGQAWYGYTPAAAADDSGRQLQAGPAVFDLAPARQSVRGPVVVSAGIAESTVPPPPGVTEMAAEAADVHSFWETPVSSMSVNRRAGGPRPAYTYDAVSMPHGLAVAALALPAGLHVMLFWRGARVRAQRIRVECSGGAPERNREKARHCHACGAKVD